MPHHAEPAYALARSHGIGAALDEWARTANKQAPAVDLPATPLGLRTWSAHFADANTALFELRHAGVLQTMLPMATRTRSMLGLHLRHWASPGNFYWQFGYPIGGGDGAKLLAALLAQLRLRRDWDVMDIGPMLVSSPPAAALLSAGQGLGLRPELRARRLHHLVVASGPWASYFAGVSRNLRDTVGNGQRRLQRQGPLSLVAYPGGPDLDAHLHAFYALEASGWKGKEGTAIACNPKTRAFYTGLAHEAAAAGQLQLYEMTVGGRLVAADYCITHGGVVHPLKIAYDPTQARCSPGQVMRWLVLQRLFEQHPGAVYDLGGGDGEHAQYKLRWANGAREYSVLRLFNPTTARGQLCSRLAAFGRRPGPATPLD
jgi:hypothetical protein